MEQFLHHTVLTLHHSLHIYSPSSNKRSGLKHGRNKTDEVLQQAPINTHTHTLIYLLTLFFFFLTTFIYFLPNNHDVLTVQTELELTLISFSNHQKTLCGGKKNKHIPHMRMSRIPHFLKVSVVTSCLEILLNITDGCFNTDNKATVESQ